MSDAYARFLDPNEQFENYKKIGIDKSMVEVNQKLFWEKNKNFYEMKEKYQVKKKGVKLENNTTMDEFVKKEKLFDKFKKGPIVVNFPRTRETVNTPEANYRQDKKVLFVEKKHI